MRFRRFLLLPLIMLAACSAAMEPSPSPTSGLLLKFSDGRESLDDLSRINEVLGTVGVHLSTIDLPPASIPLLESSARAPLSDADKAKLLELFALSRQDVLEQVRVAGRVPVLPDGGSMVTGEPGIAPYPKVYDLRSMSDQDRSSARDKFARLHVNSADTGTGVDEVMTLVAGGPWTWYFLLNDNVVVELHMPHVEPRGTGWRLSYPGLTPHGGHFHAESGLCVAYITGPQVWTMRYESPGRAGERMLGTNPWIDFNDR